MTISTLNPSTDTFIIVNSPDNNYGAYTYLPVGERNDYTAYVRRSLLKFLSLSDGTIPASAIVDTATLRLYAVTDYSSNARTFRVYRTKRAWVELEATWNIWKTGSNWSTAGGFHADDCEQTDIGYRDMTATETLNEYKEFPLTAAAIQEMISGAFTNNGFMVKADTEANDCYNFNSLDAGSNLPKLVVTWHLEGYPKIMFF